MSNIQRWQAARSREVRFSYPSNGTAPPKSRRGFWWAGALLLGGLGCGGNLVDSDDGFTLRVTAGCTDIAACRQLASEAELRVESCAFSCDSEQQDYQAARNYLRQLLEDQVARRYASLEAESNLTKERLARTRALAEEAARKDAEDAAQREHERKLEVLAFQAEQQRAAIEARRAEKLSYLRRLSLTQKLNRLRNCHEALRTCDELAALLIEASDSGAQRRALIQLNEAPAPTDLPNATPRHNVSSDAANTVEAKAALDGNAMRANTVSLRGVL